MLLTPGEMIPIAVGWDTTGAYRSPDVWWIGVVAAGHSGKPSQLPESERARGCSPAPPVPEGSDTWR